MDSLYCSRRVSQRFRRARRRARAIGNRFAVTVMDRDGIHGVILGNRLHDLSMGQDEV
jgi:hypothetical protein